MEPCEYIAHLIVNEKSWAVHELPQIAVELREARHVVLLRRIAQRSFRELARAELRAAQAHRDLLAARGDFGCQSGILDAHPLGCAHELDSLRSQVDIAFEPALAVGARLRPQARSGKRDADR